MSADELEQFAERGQDYRYVLSCSILNNLKVPQGESPAVEWYVSSAGAECDGWSACRVDSAGQVTDLY